MTRRITVATWIVLDDADTATDFPSAGRNSAAAAFQLVYWRCLVVYFLTCRVHNPETSLVLYANVDPAVAAPPRIAAMLASLNVTIRTLDISFRLPRGTVSRFGNQFYVLDVIRAFAEAGDSEAIVLTDSDCVWRRAVDGLEAALFTHECLLYTLAPADQKGYEVGRLINGMTHARMSEIAHRQFGLPAEWQVQYHGGEFFAATRMFCRKIQPAVSELWQVAYSQAAQTDSIKEEAHFLSILAEGLGVKRATANPFVRRIWTNFQDVNAAPSDEALTIWHLPAEKRFGFHRFWRYLEETGRSWDTFTPAELNRLTGQYMGVPRRSAAKLVRDVAEKLRERAARATRSGA